MSLRVAIALRLIRREIRVERDNAYRGHQQAWSPENERYWMGRITGASRFARPDFGEVQTFRPRPLCTCLIKPPAGPGHVHAPGCPAARRVDPTTTRQHTTTQGDDR